MRNLRRSNTEHDEEESVFVPMTDMTVSFLFILMILLAFFAVRFSDTDSIPKPIHDEVKRELTDVRAERDLLTIKLKELDRRIEELLAKITFIEIENQKLQEEVTDRDAQIERLLQEIEELQLEISKLLERIEALNTEKNELTEKVNRQEIKIKDLLDQIRELQRMLEEKNPLEAYIAQAQIKRLEILKQIESALKIEFSDQILVEISTENDALRFKGEGLFASNARELMPRRRPIVERLSDLIMDAIACYTVNDLKIDYKTCNPEGIVIEAVQIEGHTDSDGDHTYNIGLSADRAKSAFSVMLERRDDLFSFKNIRGQPVISVAGYGEMRPIVSNETQAGKAENRRIDLRLIMYTPPSRSEVERIQRKIKEGLQLTSERVTTEEVR